MVLKGTQECTLISIAVSTDQNIFITEEKTVERYQNLALKIKLKNPKRRVAVIPIEIGALETISKNANDWYGRFSLPYIFGSA